MTSAIQPESNVPTLSKKRRWAALVVLSFSLFVVSIDMTVLNVALPDLTADLQPTSDQQLWIIDIYSLVLAGLLVSASSLSDRWGRKRMLLAGYLVFGGGSMLIVLANSTDAVIAIRALLGIGGAMIMPTTLSMVRSIFQNPRERATALAVWSAISGLGMAIGPIIGGFLLEHFSWHAAFLVNAPLMVATFFAGLFILPEVRVKNPGRWDAVAAAVSMVGMVLLMWGIKHLAAEMSLTDPLGLGALFAGIALMAFFVIRCARSAEPLLDVRLFKSKPFTAGIVAALGSMFAMAALLFLLTQWLQLVEGYGPLESGLRLVPMAVASLVSASLAPLLATRLGTRRVMVAGLLISAAGMLMLVLFREHLTYAPVALASSLVGVGTGVLAIGSALIMLETPVEKAASAAAFEEVAYDLGNVAGVAILGSVASIVYRLGLDPLVLASSGLDQASVEAAGQSFAAAAAIAKQTGVEELMREGTASFNESIVLTSFIGGVIMLAVAFAVARLVPKDMDITRSDQQH